MSPTRLAPFTAFCLALVPAAAGAAPPQAKLVPDNVTLPPTGVRPT